jgi:hypothetical protein
VCDIYFHVLPLQPVLHMGFEWDTNEMSVLLAAKLAGPLRGTSARVVINSIHIKGDVCLTSPFLLLLIVRALCVFDSSLCCSVVEIQH